MSGVQLIVGLGNPGPDYADTRHNAGVWFVEALLRRFGGGLALTNRFKGHVAQVQVERESVRVLVPNTWMNLSGEAVAPMAAYYRIAPADILVAHDEMAFEPGTVKLKRGGGHNGHNGLRDIVRALGNRSDFARLRIGVGHPGSQEKVTPYLTSWRTPAAERDTVERAIDQALDALPELLAGQWERAMTRLHST